MFSLSGIYRGKIKKYVYPRQHEGIISYQQLGVVFLFSVVYGYIENGTVNYCLN